MELNLQDLILLRTCLQENSLENDERGKSVTHQLKVMDILDSEIEKKKSEIEYELEAERAWKESTYYEQFKDNKYVREGWIQNWIKVNAEQEILNTFIENDKK